MYVVDVTGDGLQKKLVSNIHTCSSPVKPPLNTQGSLSPDKNASLYPLEDPDGGNVIALIKRKVPKVKCKHKPDINL